MAVLDGYGLHSLTWETCDDVLDCGLVASPADAQGRGISLAVKQNGSAADLTGAKVYLVWRHRELRKRGTTEFEAIDASAGTFVVYYPAAIPARRVPRGRRETPAKSGRKVPRVTPGPRARPALPGPTARTA